MLKINSKIVKDYSLILLGSILYGLGIVLFIFPPSLFLGGTTGISVLLASFITLSPGTLSTILNLSLIVIAFIILGRDMAIKTTVGSTLTTLFISAFEAIFSLDSPPVENPYISALLGAILIAVASGIMFAVGSSSGGTDIIALIVKKFSSLKIGRALLLTDILIVVLGGIFVFRDRLVASSVGFLVKVLGIDVVIRVIKGKDGIEKSGKI